MSGTSTERRCEVDLTNRHGGSWWHITAPDGRVITSCGTHLDSLLYLQGANRVELIIDVPNGAASVGSGDSQ